MSFKFSPIKILLFSLCTWLVCVLLVPVTYLNIEPIWNATFIYMSYIICLILGMIFYRRSIKVSKVSVYKLDVRRLQKVLRIIFLLGVIGVCLRVLQRINMGMSFSLSDVSNNRMESLDMGELSGGGVSVFAAILYPFSFIALIVAIYIRPHVRTIFFVIIVFLGLFPMFDNILLGGRMTTAFQMIILLFVFQIKRAINGRKTKLPWKKILILGFIFILFYSVMGYNRYETMYFQQDNIDYGFLIGMSEKYQETSFDHWFISLLLNSNPYLSAILLGIEGLLHYIAHGFFEFVRLVNHMDEYFGTYWGKYEFYIFIKGFRAMGFETGMDFSEMSMAVMHKVGFYTTFAGPLFIDFGIFGIFFCFFFGILIQSLYQKVIMRSFIGMIFYPLFAAILFAFPILNWLMGANLYFFVAAFITVFFYLTKERQIKK